MIETFKNEILPAPLAGITNEPFRLILKTLGYKITWTEMISADGIMRKQEKTIAVAKTIKEKPTIVAQLFGSSPEIVFEAAKILFYELGYEHIDINMGCPVKKIVKKGCGVKLMGSPEIVKEMFRQLRKLPVKLFAKLRLGTSKQHINFLEIINILCNEGIDAVTVHARTGDEFFKGKANWEYIRRAKETFPDLFLIGNGDIVTPKDAEKMFKDTNCDSVMVGREIAKNPFFIKNFNSFKENFHVDTITFKRKIELFKTMLHNLLEFYNENIALNLAKKYFILFTKGYRNSSRMRQKIIKIKNCIEIFEELSYWEENH